MISTTHAQVATAAGQTAAQAWLDSQIGQRRFEVGPAAALVFALGELWAIDPSGTANEGWKIEHFGSGSTRWTLDQLAIDDSGIVRQVRILWEGKTVAEFPVDADLQPMVLQFVDSLVEARG